MRAFILIFLVALAVTLTSVPWVRQLATRLGFVDAPAKRKMHANPIPLMGGVAIFLGAIVSVLMTYSDGIPRTVMGALLAGSLVAAVGLIDDRVHLRASLRLGVQFCACLVLGHYGMRVLLPIPDWANFALTFLWLVGITNAINLLDNMDGLSAGVAGIASAYLMLIGALNGQYLVSSLSAALMGACLGFLRYNFPPAKIFMGDAGAYFLGFWLAVMGIQLRFPHNVNFVTWMVPVLVLGLPIFDTTLVSLSRILRGVHPFTPGKDHVSHRLMLLGFSSREAVLVCYLISCAFGMTALFVTQANLREGYFLGGCVLLVCLYSFLRLEAVYKAAQAVAPPAGKDPPGEGVAEAPGTTDG